jgi:hypothetical protein
MKTQLFPRTDGALIDLELWARDNRYSVVRVSYTRLHMRVVYREGPK